MAHSEISELIPAPSSAVFDLLHDYTRRLEWDTLLQAAYLDGATVAAKGVTSVCVGRKSLGGIALKTVYVTFDRPTLAAVRMVNAPLFFESWAASIRHEDVSAHESRLTYKFQFATKPHFLRFILDPLMERIFAWETRKRLHALKTFFTRNSRSQIAARDST
ncbi:MAG TPA: SRPBCC family protein [Candidatus Binatia bacterium]|nr:SRPBCC family protein [Candidatus Binatia bacterium]